MTAHIGSNRIAVRRKECPTMEEWLERIRRQCRVAGPRSVWWIRFLNGQPDALYLGTNGSKPYPRQGYSYVKAEEYLALFVTHIELAGEDTNEKGSGESCQGA